eukprot:4345912-Alexandrium_andersonii.AAC.1
MRAGTLARAGACPRAALGVPGHCARPARATECNGGASALPARRGAPGVRRRRECAWGVA